VRRKRMGGSDDDPVARVTGTLTGLSEQLLGIKQALLAGTQRGSWGASWATQLTPHLERLQAAVDNLGRPQIQLEVHTSAPEGVDELLAQQVAIIERTLIPLVRTATEHLRD